MHLRAVGAAFCSFAAPNASDPPRPIISPSSFAHQSALRDGFEIRPAPGTNLFNVAMINSMDSLHTYTITYTIKPLNITFVDGKGMGAFSTATIAKGATLGEYTGEILTRREVEARYWGMRKENKHDRKWRKSRCRRRQGISGDYLFDIGNDLFIDGEDADVSSWCRFANHANELNDVGEKDDACNVEVRRRLSWDEEEQQQLGLFFVALREITPGTEICYDYGEEYW